MSSVADTSRLKRDPRISQILAFIGTFAVLLYYALRGGSYDVVVRQEEAIAVWWVIGLGWAAGVLPRFRRPRGSRFPLLALAGLVLWTALSLGWTESDSRTLAELARDLHYAGLLVLVWSLFGAENWRAAAAGLIAAAVAVTALSLASRLTPGIFPGNHIKGVFGTNRLNYPFNYWNSVAAWCAMTIALVLAMSAHADRRWVRALCAAAIPLCGTTAYLTYARQSVLGTAAAVIVLFAISRNRWMTLVNALGGLAGAAIGILAARGEPAIVDATSGAGGVKVLLAVLAGSALAAAIAVASSVVRTDRLRMSRAVAQAVLGAAAIVVLIVALTAARPTISKGWDEFRNRTVATGTSTDPAARFKTLNGQRYVHWQSAMRAFKAHPLDGIGPGTFEFWYSRDGGPEFVRDAHSLYVESLAETGLIGFVLVILFFAGLLYVAARRRRRLDETSDIGLHAALFAAFVVFLAHAAVDWVWETTAISALAFGGIAIASVRRRAYRAPSRLHRGMSDIERQRRLARRRIWQAGRYGVPALALVAILIQIPNLASTSLIRKSQSAFNANAVALAATRADDAVRAAPWSADAYMQRGEIFESQDDLEAAATDVRSAQRLEPFNWRPPLLLSRIEAERGRVQAARAAFQQFMSLRPKTIYAPQAR